MIVVRRAITDATFCSREEEKSGAGRSQAAGRGAVDRSGQPELFAEREPGRPTAASDNMIGAINGSVTRTMTTANN
uniref:Uncharacterized protein n=1 Tax=Plectus sambesii TaxID=2011161 RepID=A0A914VMF0_9BILA